MRSQSLLQLEKAREALVRGNALRRLGQFDAAREVYLRAHELVGDNALLLAVLAACYLKLATNPDETGENFSKAVELMEKAVRLAPEDERLHARLAEYYWVANLDYDRAAQHYRIAIQLNANDVSTLGNAAALYGLPEMVVTREEAIDWLERAVKLEPDNPNYHHRLGELYKESGRAVEARQEWLRALLCPEALDWDPELDSD